MNRIVAQGREVFLVLENDAGQEDGRLKIASCDLSVFAAILAQAADSGLGHMADGNLTQALGALGILIRGEGQG